MEISSDINIAHLHDVMYVHRLFINVHCPHQINYKTDEKMLQLVSGIFLYLGLPLTAGPKFQATTLVDYLN